MTSDEETRKNGDLGKVANAMHARVSEFFHFFEKPLPAAAGSVFFGGQKAEQRKKSFSGEFDESDQKSKMCSPPRQEAQL